MSQSWAPPPPLNAPATVSNNMVLAIIALVLSLFCCAPHGIVPLIFAMQVNKKAEAGDIQGAQNAARQAKMWAWISIIVSALWIVVSLVFGVFGIIMSAISR